MNAGIVTKTSEETNWTAIERINPKKFQCHPVTSGEIFTWSWAEHWTKTKDTRDSKEHQTRTNQVQRIGHIKLKSIRETRYHKSHKDDIQGIIERDKLLEN